MHAVEYVPYMVYSNNVWYHTHYNVITSAQSDIIGHAAAG